jgi:hypothetical protein
VSDTYDLDQPFPVRFIDGEAAGYLIRRLCLPTVAAGSGLCAAVTGVGAAVARNPGDLLHLLRVDIVLLAAVAALALDDPATPLTGATSVPRRRQRLWATAIIGTVTLAAFAAIVVVSGGVIGTLDQLPVVLLTTQLLALMAIGWLIAAALADVTGRDAPGRHAAALLVLVSIASATTPWVSDRLWYQSGTSWRETSLAWCVIAGIAPFCVAWASPDRRR